MTAAPSTLTLRFVSLAATFAGLLVVAGCGDSTGLSKRYPVSGTITYNGAPVETGTIQFTPTDLNTGRPATGQISNGSYSLTTAIDGDGALPGDYKISITSRIVDTSAAMGNVPGGSPKQDDIAKAASEAKSLVPTKYSIADTSGLTYTVKEGSNRNVDFDLVD